MMGGRWQDVPNDSEPNVKSVAVEINIKQTMSDGNTNQTTHIVTTGKTELGALKKARALVETAIEEEEL